MYGALTQDKIKGIDTLGFIVKNITIRGFDFSEWIKKKNLWSKYFVTKKINKMLKNQLSTEIHKTFPLSEVKDAIECYEQNMSKGKVILKPFSEEGDKQT